MSFMTDASLSSYTSSTLNGILVGFSFIMKAGLSWFSSSLLQKPFPKVHARQQNTHGPEVSKN
ncbi:hypothetical protein DSO57_1037164 [Entomophthora muscae]|uniref:Uncharacterized protein n=1 Tax=Entomophthora muscae TaxID=34485 RepID=A0ACC2SNF8_9FUNG|nr:hypothetical protein DSO57_1037164 [Entomophthora muscae]